LAREHRSSGGFSIEDIGLAASASLLSVRSVDLHHADASSSEEASQARTPRSAPLDANNVELAVRLQPGQKFSIAVTGGRERLGAEQPTDVVEHSRDMNFLVSVDTADDDGVVMREGGHAAPCL
jgi:hypothetical protein